MMFLSYIKSRARVFLPTAAACVVFAVVFALYQLPVQPVGYGALIIGVILAVCMGIDLASFAKKRAELSALLNDLALLENGLPKPDGETERLYTEVCRALYDSKKSLESEMDRRYSDMTDYYTMWAHQIKTPIAAMRLVLQGQDTTESRELSEDLQRIELYVEMVLCYLRLDSDSTDFVIEMCSLDEILRQAIKRFSSQFIRRKLKLCYEPPEEMVLTDRKWLLFVAEQVISNAVKYTKTGSISIFFDNGALYIKDTGIGIAQEDLPRIFEKGFTGCNGRTDMKASGIGLYLCRRICKALGHTISAQSDEHGTTVRIGLERADIDLRE